MRSHETHHVSAPHRGLIEYAQRSAPIVLGEVAVQVSHPRQHSCPVISGGGGKPQCDVSLCMCSSQTRSNGSWRRLVCTCRKWTCEASGRWTGSCSKTNGGGAEMRLAPGSMLATNLMTSCSMVNRILYIVSCQSARFWSAYCMCERAERKRSWFRRVILTPSMGDGQTPDRVGFWNSDGNPLMYDQAGYPFVFFW